MTSSKRRVLSAAVAAMLAVPGIAGAVAVVQCPEDTDGDGNLTNNVDIPKVQCMSLTGGDGWVTMGDGRELYIFSFSNVSAIPAAQVLDKGVFRANSPAPTIHTRQGDEVYLTLTNVGTFNRPDLFDPHTVHYHGFPNASAIFDGLPESAVAINQQASITYYYRNVEPGTYMFHCHVEATEHMQMGMLGNLYVDPLQDQTGYGGNPATVSNKARRAAGQPESPVAPEGYVYNDGDGSTAFDVEKPIQLQAFYHVFHDASRDTQPLPFAEMKDTYPTINGRGYPMTTVAGPLHDCAPSISGGGPIPCPADHPNGNQVEQDSPQPVDSLVVASQGDRILLRLSNLGVVNHYTVTVLGIPMKVVGRDARILRGAGQGVNQNVFYETNVVTLGGGESTDVILDTRGPDGAVGGGDDVPPGTYFLYAANLNYLSNNAEDYGGYMTEIVIN